jgi:hypothetical protein
LKLGKKKTTSFVKNKPKTYIRPANEVNRPKPSKTPEKETSNEAIAKDNKPASQNEIANNNVRKNPEENKVNIEPAKETTSKVKPGAPAKSFTIAKGHYVVVGVFSMMDHSTKFTKQLLKDGLSVNVALNPKNKFYYVYIFSSYDLEEAKKARNQYRKKNLFKEAWVFTMD